VAAVRAGGGEQNLAQIVRFCEKRKGTPQPQRGRRGGKKEGGENNRFLSFFYLLGGGGGKRKAVITLLFQVEKGEEDKSFSILVRRGKEGKKIFCAVQGKAGGELGPGRHVCAHSPEREKLWPHTFDMSEGWQGGRGRQTLVHLGGGGERGGKC